MSQPTDVPPDGATADLACPLCDYSLRGLTEPRCPECGFAFAWAELIDAKRDHHPWLFEHARPGRRARAFVATYARSAVPRRFWRTVTPANPVRVGRLLAYWVVANAVVALALVVPVVRMAIVAGRADLTNRAMYRPTPGRPGSFDGPDPDVVRYYTPGSMMTFGGRIRTVSVTAAKLDAIAPRLLSTAFVAQVWEAWRDDATSRRWRYSGPTLSWLDGNPIGTAVAVVLAWPWLSLAALLVFQASMRRAKVRPGHVLRAVVYGCDVGLLAVLAAVLLFGTPFVVIGSDPYFGPGQPWRVVIPTDPFRPDVVPALAALLLCGVAAGYRLTVAYRRYLRFEWPALTVLASQTMVVLAVTIVLLRTVRLF